MVLARWRGLETEWRKYSTPDRIIRGRVGTVAVRIARGGVIIIAHSTAPVVSTSAWRCGLRCCAGKVEVKEVTHHASRVVSSTKVLSIVHSTYDAPTFITTSLVKHPPSLTSPKPLPAWAPSYATAPLRPVSRAPTQAASDDGEATMATAIMGRVGRVQHPRTSTSTSAAPDSTPLAPAEGPASSTPTSVTMIDITSPSSDTRDRDRGQPPSGDTSAHGEHNALLPVQGLPFPWPIRFELPVYQGGVLRQRRGDSNDDDGDDGAATTTTMGATVRQQQRRRQYGAAWCSPVRTGSTPTQPMANPGPHLLAGPRTAPRTEPNPECGPGLPRVTPVSLRPYPYPYPSKPVPATTGTGTRAYGYGYSRVWGIEAILEAIGPFHAVTIEYLLSQIQTDTTSTNNRASSLSRCVVVASAAAADEASAASASSAVGVVVIVPRCRCSRRGRRGRLVEGVEEAASSA
ncbi:hypothetical protein EDB84DRAFT_1444275 [Lactarius hengduanensis]|nr:hypothetical protein EDB84DRAFT_1444275 [Lactarius hengduanensis]